MSFRDKFSKLKIEKNSFLCIGLDPALPKQRNNATIPKKYIDIYDENEARLNFCLDTLDMVKDYAVAVKVNQQYFFGFSKEQHKRLTNNISKNDMLSILDYKLNDISETIKSAIFHISESGYDAITFNPFPGNLKYAVQYAHESIFNFRNYELGIFVITFMSNPEAEIFTKKGKIGRVPLFKVISKQVKEFDADGCVVGATDQITEKDIRIIRRIVGQDKIFLIPGIGTQKGSINKVLKAGKNLLINIGRDIIYSDNPKIKAKEWHTLLKNNLVK